MLRIVGDINLTDGFFDTGMGVGTQIAKGLNPFRNLSFSPQDYWIGNFEGVSSAESNRKGIYSRQFNVKPELLKSFQHLQLYGVANNHIMQHGGVAFKETLKTINVLGADYVGASNKRHAIVHHQGKRIVVAAFNQRVENFSDAPLYWYRPEYKEIEQELTYSSDADYKIAYIHWGIEFINFPYKDQKQFAHWLVDAGFNLIIGMHPHVLQGYEIYKGKHIFYSLGNFVFNMVWEPTKYSIIVNVDFENGVNISYNYVKIGTDFCPRVVTEVPEPYTMEYLNKLLATECENEAYYAKAAAYNRSFQKCNRINFVQSMLQRPFRESAAILTDFVKRKI